MWECPVSADSVRGRRADSSCVDAVTSLTAAAPLRRSTRLLIRKRNTIHPMNLGRFPRVRFAHLPTPLEHLPNLSRNPGWTGNLDQAR